VPADQESIARIIGPRRAKLYIKNSAVSEYRVVLAFGNLKVIRGNQLKRALEKYAGSGFTLIVGHNFTIEARTIASEAACHLISESTYPYTDAMRADRA
jgi:hypothetical protein